MNEKLIIDYPALTEKLRAYGKKYDLNFARINKGKDPNPFHGQVGSKNLYRVYGGKRKVSLKIYTILNNELNKRNEKDNSEEIT